MYILKNALRCIGRSKGRNILIGIIVLVIATAACIGLSVRQASKSAKETNLDSLTITANISYDVDNAMSGIRENMGKVDFENGERPSFDRDSFAGMMGGNTSLTLEEYKTYAEASSVQNFYYTATVYVNGNDALLPVSTETSDGSQENSDQKNEYEDFMGDFGGEGMPGGGPGGMGMFDFGSITQSDFVLKGFSSDSAMTSFLDGTASIEEGNGTVFEEGTAELDCIISVELATYNSLEVGDVITIVNPANEEETYELTVVGMFTDSTSGSSGTSRRGFNNDDPINQIYVSYNALETIITASEENSVEVTDENTGRTSESAFTSDVAATYVFANADDYYTFEEEVRSLGLDDSYKVNSQDIEDYKDNADALEGLDSFANVFLIVILLIGAIILIVLNIFSVRERKYEIGVLTAMGMKKSKVAIQFIIEIFIVSLVAVIIGIGVGGVSAVPVSNTLLQKELAAQETKMNDMQMNFGGGDRDFSGMPGMPGGGMGGPGGGQMFGPSSSAPKEFDGAFAGAKNYISEINSAMNLTVVLQMFLIAIGLTLVAGLASVLFIMRYEPLKILANRD